MDGPPRDTMGAFSRTRQDPLGGFLRSATPCRALAKLRQFRTGGCGSGDLGGPHYVVAVLSGAARAGPSASMTWSAIRETAVVEVPMSR